MDSSKQTPLTIGFVEYVALPDWGINRLRAKVDTGARTSALHVSSMEEISGNRLKFTIVLDRKRHHRRVECEAPIARTTTIRSSNGMVEKRYVVHTTLQIGSVRKTIDVSLTSRGRMIYRMLLGRRALEEDFLIDAGKRFVASEQRLKRVKKKKKKKPRHTSEEE
ncbi:RimK/LysX family protein [bacterium]|nr:RimK/LysX family protein [bacterium]